MTELNCSPQNLHQLIDQYWHSVWGNWEEIPEDLQTIFKIAKKITPIPPQPRHGKECKSYGCTHRMHCKTIICPKCHHKQRNPKKQKPRVTTTITTTTTTTEHQLDSDQEDEDESDEEYNAVPQPRKRQRVKTADHIRQDKIIAEMARWKAEQEN